MTLPRPDEEKTAHPDEESAARLDCESPARPDEENVARPVVLTLHRAAATTPTRPWALAIHGGAGGRIVELAERAGFEAGLTRAHEAGEAVLAQGGTALDAVSAAVQVLEDDPLFNAGRGAALNRDGQAELDASIMDGATGRAGAVAASRHARSAVLAARAVMDRTEHVLLVDPPAALVESWGLEIVEPGWFVTEERLSQLRRLLAQRELGPRHGTVGAVALDAQGHLAAATSTGGISAQDVGRIGDSPVIGAGTYARDGLVAISGTGEGEAFLRGVVAYDVAARMRYVDAELETAVADTIRDALTARGSSGGVIAVDAAGQLVVAHNSPMMFSAYRDGEELRVHL